jgi:hypothetical protein
MPEIIQANTIAGGGQADPYYSAGSPSSGTNEVWTLTIGGSGLGGTFKIAAGPNITAAITWSATNATLLSNIQTALNALPTIGASGVAVTAGTLTSGIGTVTITFSGGNMASLALPANFLTVAVSSTLTGTSPTLALAQTTAGVTATARNAAVGAMLLDNVNGKLYINTGTNLVPTWTVVGTQT